MYVLYFKEEISKYILANLKCNHINIESTKHEIRIIERCVFKTNDTPIELKGLTKIFDKEIMILNLNLPNIKCKRVNLNELNHLNSTNMQNFTAFKNSLNQIICDLFSESLLIYKLTIKQNTDETKANISPTNMVEIYITFFYNFPEINSVKDNVYEELSRLLIENISICVLDVTKYSNFILTKKWTDFEKDNLNTKTIGKHVYYAFSNVNGQMNILFAGLKKYLGPLKDQVGEFLSDNEIKNAKVALRQEDVSGLLKDIYLFSNFVRILFYFKDALFETRCI